MKGVQCYELFGGIALKSHAFSFSFILSYVKPLFVINDSHSSMHHLCADDLQLQMSSLPG